MKRLVIVLLACILAVPAFGAEVLPFAPSVDSDAVAAQTADKLALYSWVTSLEGRDKAAPYQVQVPLTDLAALKSHVPTGGPLWIGVDAEMNLVVDPSKAAFGSTTFADGFQVWTGSPSFWCCSDVDTSER